MAGTEPVTTPSQRPPQPAPRIASAVVVFGVLAALLLVGLALRPGPSDSDGCQSGGDGPVQVIGDRGWGEEQLDNARLVIETAAADGLPQRAAVIAVSTAIVESELCNVAYGDRDSLGLFQQRPSQGWGTPADVMDPQRSTEAFLDRLVRIPGWAAMPPGQAAQALQRSAYPERYGPQEDTAAALTDWLQSHR